MKRPYAQAKTPYKIVGTAQNYFWGKVGERSRIAGFPGVSNSREPLAEYWLGDHPRGVASVELEPGKSVPLPNLFGAERRLSFMLKVLSINPEFGLSIQSHPDALLARRLHAKDPDNYPDSSHKPELGVALSTVTLAYGFKPFSDLQSSAKMYPELELCWGHDLMQQLVRGCAVEHEPELVEMAFTQLMQASASNVARVTHGIVARFGSTGDAPAEVRRISKLLLRHGEEDVGLLALLMLNLVSLNPGEGIFIGPNIPHAYLEGDLVECMACSDNVIRAGLTTKFKDVDTLLASVDYSRVGLPLLSIAKRGASGISLFEAPAREFTLGVVTRGGSQIATDSAGAIALCLGGNALVVNEESANSVSLSDGEAALLLPGSGTYECRVDGGQVFVAFGERLP